MMTVALFISEDVLRVLMPFFFFLSLLVRVFVICLAGEFSSLFGIGLLCPRVGVV